MDQCGAAKRVAEQAGMKIRELQRASIDIPTDLVRRLGRPMRFIVVGCAGLATDLTVFTLIAAFGHHPLAVRLVSLGVATLVTWRLNRAFTFARSNRAQTDEALRYA